MTAAFEFATAGRIVFGAGTLERVAEPVRAWGTRALVVTGRDPKRADPLRARLAAAGVETAVFPVPGEPTVDDVARGTEALRASRGEVVLGMGGGSALDAAKAVAALATNPGDVLDYLEVIGAGRPLTRPGLPCVAVPTTAGTGAEVTRNAVLGSPAHRVKVSLRHPFLLPRLAVVDPRLTDHLPPEVTARSGLDALTQLIEPYVSSRANPFTDALCREGLVRAARSLRRACEDGADPAARDDLALASLCGGLALANAGLGAVHGFAAPIGGMFNAPHGSVCAALLAPVMTANLRALRSRQPEAPARARYAEVARLLTGSPDAAAEDGVRWVEELCRALRVAPLARYGIGPADTAAIVEKAGRASSMQANPLPLTAQELAGCLEAAGAGR